MIVLKKIALALSLALVAACGGKDAAELNCRSAFLCAAECPDDDCIEACMDDARPEARAQMIDLALCASDAGCDTVETTEECLQAACAAELRACLN
jgi:hypothetical protein